MSRLCRLLFPEVVGFATTGWAALPTTTATSTLSGTELVFRSDVPRESMVEGPRVFVLQDEYLKWYESLAANDPLHTVVALVPQLVL